MTASTILAALVAGETTADAVKASVKAKKIDALEAIDALEQFAASKAKPAAIGQKSARISEPKPATGNKPATKGGYLGFYGFSAGGRPIGGMYAEQLLAILSSGLLVEALRQIETSPHVTAQKSTVESVRKEAAALRVRLEAAGFGAPNASASKAA